MGFRGGAPARRLRFQSPIMATHVSDYDPIVIPKQRPLGVILIGLVMAAVIAVLSWSVWHAVVPHAPTAPYLQNG
jgi:hypothetical protein